MRLRRSARPGRVDEAARPLWAAAILATYSSNSWRTGYRLARSADANETLHRHEAHERATTRLGSGLLDNTRCALGVTSYQDTLARSPQVCARRPSGAPQPHVRAAG